MIVPLMTFLLVVSVVASLAAVAADAGLRRLRLPSRWAWLGAMGLGWLLLAVGRLLPARTGAAGDGLIRPIELPPLVVGEAQGSWIDVLALLPGPAWVLCSLGAAALLMVTHRRLVAERARWERRRVLGRDVFVSSDRGPAVAGVLRPWIVLPRWALSLPRSELSLVLLHEEEHMRARDCALLAAALAVVVLTAWNPIVWWQLRRLRLAMEMDCDRRVLARDPDAETYGRSLLSVAARASGPTLGLAAFTERGASLKERILTMTARRTRWTATAAILLLALAGAVAAQACFVEISVTTDRDDEPTFRAVEVPSGGAGREADAPAAPTAAEEATLPPEPARVASPRVAETRADEELRRLRERTEPPVERRREGIALSEEPTFTPMTVRPEILNRNEVMAAMEREYPPLLRDAGIGGTVRVHFFITETGEVGNSLLAESSGHQALDQAALRVASVYRFSPAMNRDDPVPVWVQFGITFQVR